MNEQENPNEEIHYYVLRTHSHTDRQQLWRVMSRRFLDEQEANNWRDYVASQEKNPSHEFFVVACRAPAEEHPSTKNQEPTEAAIQERMQLFSENYYNAREELREQAYGEDHSKPPEMSWGTYWKTY